MQPADNKRILPPDYYVNHAQPDAKKSKPNDHDSQVKVNGYALQKFNSSSSEEDYSSEIDISDMEVCESTDDLNNLPPIWHSAENGDWETVDKLLYTCSTEDFKACPNAGPNKNKTLLISAVLRERWDIVAKIAFHGAYIGHMWNALNDYFYSSISSHSDYNKKAFSTEILRLILSKNCSNYPIDLKFSEEKLYFLEEKLYLMNKNYKEVFLTYVIECLTCKYGDSDCLFNKVRFGGYDLLEDLDFLQKISWIYEISLDKNKIANDQIVKMIKFVFASILDQWKDSKKIGNTTGEEVRDWTTLESLLAINGISISPSCFIKICNAFNTISQILLNFEFDMHKFKNEEELKDSEKDLEDSKNHADVVLKLLFQLGTQFSNLYELKIPIFDQIFKTFERIATLQNQSIWVPKEMYDKIALSLIAEELPILEGIPEHLLIKALNNYNICLPHIVSLAFMEFRWQNGLSGYPYTKEEIDLIHQKIEKCLKEFIAEHPGIQFTQKDRERIAKEIGKDQNVDEPILDEALIKNAIATAMRFQWQPEREIIDLEEKVDIYETIKFIATLALQEFSDANGIFIDTIENLDFCRLIETCLLEFKKQHPQVVFTDDKIQLLVKEIGIKQNIEHPKLKKSYIENAIRKVMLNNE
jgi:hypothetical protein